MLVPKRAGGGFADVGTVARIEDVGALPAASVVPCTANQLETVAAPLLDRMEVVSLDGYTEDEKVAIARDHLLRRQRAAAGRREAEGAGRSPGRPDRGDPPRRQRGRHRRHPEAIRAELTIHLCRDVRQVLELALEPAAAVAVAA